jgi:hypothetical protein
LTKRKLFVKFKSNSGKNSKIMKINDKNYTIEFIPDLNKVIFVGNLRLQSIEKYNEIMEFIVDNVKDSNEPIILDLTNLNFINSSGIASLGMLFIKLREYDTKIRILASKYVNWHVGSLKDFQNINTNIEIDYVVQH